MTEELSDARLAELRRVAGAAAPGPWFVEYQEADGWTSVYGQPYDADGQMLLSPEVATTEGEPDSESRHIAAFDPPTVLALLDEIEQLRRWKTEALEVLKSWERVLENAGGPGRVGQSKAEANDIHERLGTVLRDMGDDT